MQRLAAAALVCALASILIARDARAQATPSAAASAGAPDWTALAAEEEVQVVTHDAGGELRDTTIWLAVVDGQGYLRTGETRWRANLERDPDTVFRIAGREYPMRAQHVTDPELIARINAVFREKYGFSDRFIGWFSDPAEGYFIAMVARPPAP
jgi:hypothetical protein